VQETVQASYRKVSERDLARQVVATAGNLTSPRRLGRVARLLSQRGFDEDTIETALGMLNDQC
jgi:SOS response regulatory protein OraA/RecX